MSQELKSSIFTPDPYYIPGYEGFFPQLRYQLGHTYGTTTSRLLTDPSIMKSPHSLLSPLRPPATKTAEPPKLPRAQDGGFPVENEIVLPEMYIPPGYAGHRPMLQYQHATSFSRMVSNAVDEFTEMQTSVMRGQMKRPQERSTEDTFPRQWKPMAEYTSPLTSYSKNPQIDLSQRLQRKAITGYTGFIPRYCWTFGVGYRPGVKTSMDEFERMQASGTHMALPLVTAPGSSTSRPVCEKTLDKDENAV
ncbi:ciliary microtubule inner protein 2A isoform X2 [Engystomops pustulosus]|uniref:ciliary microtubule inner protein 2A isoform X2 n=1 Tax=Engystomops pustulosus TaxID=76066 RepID=UPI003AFAD714